MAVTVLVIVVALAVANWFGTSNVQRHIDSQDGLDIVDYSCDYEWVVSTQCVNVSQNAND